MPAATAERRAIPTIRAHAEGCPASDLRQEVWIADIHGRDGSVTGRSGVAHCQDCGRIERVSLEAVEAYLGQKE